MDTRERTALCVRARASACMLVLNRLPPPAVSSEPLACCTLLLCNRGSVGRGEMASSRVACGRGMGKSLRCRCRCGEKWPHVGRLRPFPVSANHGRFDARPRVFSAHVFWCVFSRGIQDKFASAEGPMFAMTFQYRYRVPNWAASCVCRRNSSGHPEGGTTDVCGLHWLCEDRVGLHTAF